MNKKIKENSVECRILRTWHSGQGKYEMLGLNRAYTANLNDKHVSVANGRLVGCHAVTHWPVLDTILVLMVIRAAYKNLLTLYCSRLLILEPITTWSIPFQI